VAFGSADARPQMDARCHDSHFPTSSTFDIHPNISPMYCICLYLLLAALERSVNAGNVTRRALRLATIYIVPPIFELFRQYLDWTLLSSAHMLVKFVFACSLLQNSDQEVSGATCYLILVFCYMVLVRSRMSSSIFISSEKPLEHISYLNSHCLPSTRNLGHIKYCFLLQSSYERALASLYTIYSTCTALAEQKSGAFVYCLVLCRLPSESESWLK
jgi:hypothetical protein